MIISWWITTDGKNIEIKIWRNSFKRFAWINWEIENFYSFAEKFAEKDLSDNKVAEVLSSIDYHESMYEKLLDIILMIMSNYQDDTQTNWWAFSKEFIKNIQWQPRRF